ncbi:hypothetical protein BpHYR1_024842 [Brachionus plicatilis]|uniref:Uncharacterized protein n=1 Tax=Brachionus plicatilis TaxID=10195 RepID=A0A3M7PK65_BRAPC|nr:hypothetical protein BpHYR1_024842 [Brachionus plicatilis]
MKVNLLGCINVDKELLGGHLTRTCRKYSPNVVLDVKINSEWSLILLFELLFDFNFCRLYYFLIIILIVCLNAFFWRDHNWQIEVNDYIFEIIITIHVLIIIRLSFSI